MATAVPTDYRKPQSEMIYDLIEKSNPGFKDAYPIGSVVFGTPTVIAVDGGDPFKNDTSILVTPTAASGGIGKVTVKYRRIDLAALFKNVIVKLDNYHTSTGCAPAIYVPWVSARYGLSLTGDDFNPGNTILSGTQYSRGPLANCLCYKGAFNVLWTLGKRPITDLITDANRALVGRLFPGGNDFSAGRKPTGEFMTITQDATEIKTILQTIPSAWVPPGGANAGLQQICDWLNANSGVTGWNIGNANTPGGTANIQWYRYTLPNANVPEADSVKYNTVVLIQSSPDSWFTGRCVLQYKV
ncbi:hypothetical protein D3C85_249480 [compost metagenome]